MLLWFLNWVNTRFRSSSMFMLTLSDFIINVAAVNVMAYASPVKLTLLFLIASVGANTYDNTPSIVAYCDDSSMHLNVEFQNPFHGLLYGSGDPFSSSCSFPASPGANNTELMLTLPFRSCAFGVYALDEDSISISGTVVVQQHRMVKTLNDTSLNVTCVHSLPMDTFREWYFPNSTLTDGHLYTNGSLTVTEVVSRLETLIGSDLFSDESDVEADLFLVISVSGVGVKEDMYVQNCVAHDDEVLTDETTMYQLSDVYGCPNTSYILKNFTVTNQTNGRGDLMAYTRLEHVSLIAIGELFVSCGIVLCKKSCQVNCGVNGSRNFHNLDDIVVKKFVRRHPGATIPSSLEDFDRRQDLRISKRSVKGSRFSLDYALRPKDEVYYNKMFASNVTVWEQAKNDGNISGFLTDFEVSILSEDRIEEIKLHLGNKTAGVFNKLATFEESRKIWDRLSVALLLFIFLVGYCGFLFWTRVN